MTIRRTTGISPSIEPSESLLVGNTVLTADQLSRAVHAVTAHAYDDADRDDLLAALGLTDHDHAKGMRHA